MIINFNRQNSLNTISAPFMGGIVSCDPRLMQANAPRGTFAIAFDHHDSQKTGGYFIKANGEIVRVGGQKLPAIAELLASIETYVPQQMAA